MKTITSLIVLLAAAFLPLAVNADHGNNARRHHDIALRSENVTTSIEKRGFSNARFTYFAVGLGACGRYSHPGDFMVALNSAQFGGGYPGPNCFKMITISYGGKTAQAQILDECPGCPYGGLDFSKGLFDYFASESLGVLYGEWSFSDGSGGGGSSGSSGNNNNNNNNDDDKKTTTTKKKAVPTTTAEKTTSTAARVIKTTSSKTSSSTSKSSSSKASSTHKSSSSTSASSAKLQGDAANLAVPTGSANSGASYYGKSLASLNQAIIQVGGLIEAAGSPQ